MQDFFLVGSVNDSGLNDGGACTGQFSVHPSVLGSPPYIATGGIALQGHSTS